MNGQPTYTLNFKRIAGVAIVGFALAISFYKLDGAAARGWCLLGESQWVALEVLRPLAFAVWQSIRAFVCEDLGCLQHLLKIVASVWPLLCALAA